MVFFFFRYFGHGIHEIDRIGKIVKLKRALDMLFLQLPLIRFAIAKIDGCFL